MKMLSRCCAINGFVRLLTFLCYVSVSGHLMVARADQPVDYLRDIKPILEDRCYACHGALKQQSGLRLDTAQAIVRGGESGPAVDPGRGSKSLMIEAVTGDIDTWRMPPEGEALEPDQIALLRKWIDEGAPLPEHEEAQPDPRTHWAFQRPVPPKVPSVVATRSVGNPIDAFMAAKHEQLDLAAAPRAERHVLLRRVYLDLIGLPPTRQQLREFLNDDSADAWQRVVDLLLASPHYGERWGRHWMDIWRYADSSDEGSNQVRSSPQHIWRWRDWIIESLNQDKGYDRIIVEMLAGDEVAPDDQDTLRATGFLARNWYKYNRNVWLDDTVEHTAKAFLGLTYGCAKCHDHKYDPISQKNYYQMRAFFEPHDVRIDPVPGQTDIEKDGVARVFDAKPQAPTYLFHRGDEKQPDRDNPLSPGLPDVFDSEVEVLPVTLPAHKGDPNQSSGRRLALANWIACRDNPLTARVAVNHIWLRHFGAPLVEQVADFGLRSKRSEFGDLLDWLAVDFMDHRWSMKRLHRHIVLSATYQRSSNSQHPQSTDPNNRYLSRMNHRRLEGEIIRDSVLHVAGNLVLRMGGKEIPLEEGETSRRRSVYFRHGHERKVEFLDMFDSASVLECYRRSTSIIPQQALALSNSVVSRSQSRLLARELSRETDSDRQFVRLAFEQILGRYPDDAELERSKQFLRSQQQLVARTKLSYPKDGPSVATKASKTPQHRARESLIHVLMNHNDFVTIR